MGGSLARCSVPSRNVATQKDRIGRGNSFIAGPGWGRLHVYFLQHIVGMVETRLSFGAIMHAMSKTRDLDYCGEILCKNLNIVNGCREIQMTVVFMAASLLLDSGNGNNADFHYMSRAEEQVSAIRPGVSIVPKL